MPGCGSFTVEEESQFDPGSVVVADCGTGPDGPAVDTEMETWAKITNNNPVRASVEVQAIIDGTVVDTVTGAEVGPNGGSNTVNLFFTPGDANLSGGDSFEVTIEAIGSQWSAPRASNSRLLSARPVSRPF